MLTGRLRGPEDLDKDDWRRTVPRFSAENFPKNLELVDELTSFAERKGCSTGQLVLAWLLEQWDMVVPIPGTTKMANFKANMDALDVRLSDAKLQQIRSAIAKVEIIGDRYPPGWSQTLLVDTVELK
jgi:aryl-alcohol dehydrogenase-like predicted oxidoreductase